MKNTNCLEGRACPSCGNEDTVLLNTRMWVSLTDAGTDPYADAVKDMSEVEYDDNSPARCPDCGHMGVFGGWQISNHVPYTRILESLLYWSGVTECVCESDKPQGSCLKCDIDEILRWFKQEVKRG